MCALKNAGHARVCAKRQLQQIASPGVLVCDGCHRPASWLQFGPVGSVYFEAFLLLFPLCQSTQAAWKEGIQSASEECTEVLFPEF